MRGLLILSLAALLILNIGCAQESQVAQTPDTTLPPGRGTGGVPGTPGGDTGIIEYDDGATATLVIDGGKSRLRQFFKDSLPNNPTNIRVNIDLSRSEDAVIIAYDEGGVTVEAAMGTLHPNSNVSDSRYNGWTTWSGSPVYKGFFQDSYGAVVLVVDKVLNLGDGNASEFVGGSIYFQNFNQYWPNNPNQGPLQMCWNITYGPYDCRTFLVGENVDINSSLYPPAGNKGPTRDIGYTKLGEFSGLSRAAAGL